MHKENDLIDIWSKNLDRSFSKVDIQKSHKDKKGNLMLLVISEMQSKTQQDTIFTATGMVTIKQTKTKQNTNR